MPSPTAVPASGSSSEIDCAERVAVGGRSDQRLRLGAERDESDLELLRAAGRGTSASRRRRRRGASARRRSPASSRRRRRAARSSRSGRAARAASAGGRARRPRTRARARAGQRDEPLPARRRAGTRSARTCEVRERDGVLARRRSIDDRERDQQRDGEQRQQQPGATRSSSGGAPHADLHLRLRAARERLARRSRQLHLRSDLRRPAPGSPTARPGGGGPCVVERGGVPGVDERLARRARDASPSSGAPAFSGTVLNTRSSGGPTGVTSAAIVFRTATGAGMQPMNGLNEPARWCAETARKSADGVRRPPERDRARRGCRRRSRGCRASSRAPSVPATTPFPCGQLSANTTSPCAGTATHGPSTGMQRGMPLHSFAAAPRRRERRRRRARATRRERATSAASSHTSLRNHQAESAAPARMSTNAASVTTGRDLAVLLRVDEPRAQLLVDLSSSLAECGRVEVAAARPPRPG